MSPELLETFLDLAETRSFARTADRLGLSQSTVSDRLKALETALGARLFDRSRAGTRLTEAGARFEPHARDLRHAMTQARRAAAGAGAMLRIGLQHDLAGGGLARWVAQVRAAFPRTTIYVEPDYSAQMAADVLSGVLDVAVLYTPRPQPDLHFEPVGTAWYVMVSTHATRLADVDPARTIRANYAPAFDAAHRALHPGLEGAPVGSGQNAAVAGLLAALGGTAYVLAQTAAEMEGAGTVRPVQDAAPIGQPVHAAVHLRNRTQTLHRRLMGLARRHFAERDRAGRAPG
jgi:LysR family transcriptional regulator, flagellar master operon regulator